MFSFLVIWSRRWVAPVYSRLGVFVVFGLLLVVGFCCWLFSCCWSWCFLLGVNVPLVIVPM